MIILIVGLLSVVFGTVIVDFCLPSSPPCPPYPRNYYADRYELVTFTADNFPHVVKSDDAQQGFESPQIQNGASYHHYFSQAGEVAVYCKLHPAMQVSVNVSSVEAPTPEPSSSPTSTPSASPTSMPTVSPTSTPTPSPSETPTRAPTDAPSFTPQPSASPTGSPTMAPTVMTMQPTSSPVASGMDLCSGTFPLGNCVAGSACLGGTCVTILPIFAKIRCLITLSYDVEAQFIDAAGEVTGTQALKDIHELLANSANVPQQRIAITSAIVQQSTRKRATDISVTWQLFSLQSDPACAKVDNLANAPGVGEVSVISAPEEGVATCGMYPVEMIKEPMVSTSETDWTLIGVIMGVSIIACLTIVAVVVILTRNKSSKKRKHSSRRHSSTQLKESGSMRGSKSGSLRNSRRASTTQKAKEMDVQWLNPDDLSDDESSAVVAETQMELQKP